MTKLTNQEIFNKALFGIREQNYEQSGKDDSCAYRGKNGTKCAVGHCIDDATAERWDGFFDSSIRSIFHHSPEEYSKVFDNEQLPLLAALQAVHDTTLDLLSFAFGQAEFEQEMKNIAQQFNLVYTPVNETN